MVEHWHKLRSDAEARTFDLELAAKHRTEIEAGQFWADRIKELRDEPVQRLELAIENLPLPAAFREATIALRALIRDCRKSKKAYEEQLSFLYWLAAIASFSIPYSERLQAPGFSVFSSIPGTVLKSLPITYKELGYEKLELLKKTDVKWIVESWGEPSSHHTMHELYHDVWREYEDKLIAAGQTRDSEIREELKELLSPESQAEKIGKRAGSAFVALRKILLRKS